MLDINSRTIHDAGRARGTVGAGKGTAPHPRNPRRRPGDVLGHSLEALADDDLSTVDSVNVLRAGMVEPAEFEKGCWRYRVRTRRMVVVIAFRSESEIRIVTAWREKR
jgi:hypothetical protein